MMFCGIPRDELMLAADKKRLKGLKDVKKRDANAPSIDRIPLPSLSEHIKNERRLAFRDMQLKKVCFLIDLISNIYFSQSSQLKILHLFVYILF